VNAEAKRAISRAYFMVMGVPQNERVDAQFNLVVHSLKVFNVFNAYETGTRNPFYHAGRCGF